MKQRNRKMTRKAFTMVELMAVLIIIGLLAAAAVGTFMHQIDRSKVITTNASLKTLHNAVLQFKMDTGHYPSEDLGLWELVEEPPDLPNWNPGGYLETTDVPLDAWNNEFDYFLSPESGKPFVIISYGNDGQEEGEGFDADLYSTDTTSRSSRRDSGGEAEYEDY
jgi:general secretion pathway protein G